MSSSSVPGEPVVGVPAAGRRLVVAAALVDDLVRPSTLLAARRTEPPALAGFWELPGGKVEPGETPHAALHRELAEELGVQVELGAELVAPGRSQTWPLTQAYLLRVWLARVVVGSPTPLEGHDAVRVLPAQDWLTTVRWLPGDLPVVQALAAIAAGAR